MIPWSTVKLVRAFFATLAMAALAQTGLAQEPMRYIYPAPESALDHRLEYYWGLLGAALDASRSSYGPYEMRKSHEGMNAARVAASLESAAPSTGAITVAVLNSSAAREKSLLAVKIPLDKGLTGYRMFLIKQATQDRLDNVQTARDLQAISFGQGSKWVDSEILQAAGMHVELSMTYEGLFQMLNAERFQVFPRGVNEIADELVRHKASMPELAIEKNLLLYYPQPRYFFFSSTPEGRRLAKRVSDGLQQLINSGEFELRYRQFKTDVLANLSLAGRRVIRLDNPALSPDTPLANKDLWDSLSAELKAPSAPQ